MKKPILAFLMLLVMLGSIAPLLAQTFPYYIRADVQTNLRSSHSIHSPIVMTVPVGTVLQVISAAGAGDRKWLKIRHNGNEVWMWSGVYHSQVNAPQASPAQPANSSQPQAPAQQSSQDVDNYCFVNRTCTTETDWIRGWEDYQRDNTSGVVQTGQPSQPQLGDFMQFSGHGGTVTGQVVFSPGTWKSTTFTNDYIIVKAHPISNNYCFWRLIGGSKTLNNKRSSRHGAGSQESRIFKVHRSCTAHLEIFNVDGDWRLELQKLG